MALQANLEEIKLIEVFFLTNKLIKVDDLPKRKNLTNRWKTRQCDKTWKAQVATRNNSDNVTKQKTAIEGSKSTIKICRKFYVE